MDKNRYVCSSCELMCSVELYRPEHMSTLTVNCAKLGRFTTFSLDKTPKEFSVGQEIEVSQYPDGPWHPRSFMKKVDEGYMARVRIPRSMGSGIGIWPYARAIRKVKYVLREAKDILGTDLDVTDFTVITDSVEWTYSNLIKEVNSLDELVTDVKSWFKEVNVEDNSSD